MSPNVYAADQATGGVAGALDYIDPLNSDGLGTLLAAGDCAFVKQDDGTGVLLYELFDDGSSSSPPDIVVPVSNPGTFAWKSKFTNKIERVLGTTITPGSSQVITHSADPDNKRIVKAGLTSDSGTTVLMLPDIFDYEITSSTQTTITMRCSLSLTGDLYVCIILP